MYILEETGKEDKKNSGRMTNTTGEIKKTALRVTRGNRKENSRDAGR